MWYNLPNGLHQYRTTTPIINVSEVLFRRVRLPEAAHAVDAIACIRLPRVDRAPTQGKAGVESS